MLFAGNLQEIHTNPGDPCNFSGTLVTNKFLREHMGILVNPYIFSEKPKLLPLCFLMSSPLYFETILISGFSQCAVWLQFHIFAIFFMFFQSIRCNTASLFIRPLCRRGFSTFYSISQMLNHPGKMWDSEVHLLWDSPLLIPPLSNVMDYVRLPEELMVFRSYLQHSEKLDSSRIKMLFLRDEKTCLGPEMAFIIYAVEFFAYLRLCLSHKSIYRGWGAGKK